MNQKLSIIIILLSLYNINLVEGQDLNSISGSGFNIATGYPALNGPENTVIMGIQNYYDANYKWQLVNAHNTNNYYLRSYVYGWGNYYRIWHSGNLNKVDVDFSSKNLISTGTFQTINRDSPGATWDNLSIWSDGENSYLYANGDEKGLHIKSNGGNKILLESIVGIGLANPLATLDIERGNSAYGTACFRGTNRYSHFNYSSEENTYIRGGKTTSNVIINDDGGNVLIGKASQINSNYKLDIAGKIRADEIVVNTTGADFVFEPGYKLRPLSEVETFIKTNKHLPDIATAKEMQENGVSAGEMQAKLLQKVEELTLYVIEKDKEIAALKAEKDRQLGEQHKLLMDLKKEIEILKTK